MLAQHKHLKAEVLARPDDDAPRLVFADWLTEQGDPRGEFIRIQCELHEKGPEDPDFLYLAKQELAMLKTHGGTWKQSVLDRAARAKLYRGFIEHVQMGVRQFIRDAKSVLEEEPIRRVLLTALSGKSIHDFLASEALSSMRELEFSTDLEAGDWKRLGGSPKLSGLEGMYVTGNLQLENTRALLEDCSFAPALKHLRLSALLDEIDTAFLEKGHAFAQLRSLDLSGGGVSGSKLLAFIQGGHPRLETLALRTMPDQTQHSQVLHVALEELPMLRSLDLSTTAFQARTTLESLNTTNIQAKHLRSLHLEHCQVETSLLTNLFENWELPKFTALDLSEAILVGSDLDSIQESPTFRRLKNLNLAGNKTLAETSVVNAIRAGAFDNLRVLSLADNRYGPDVAQAILDREPMELTQLDLSFNDVPNHLQKQMRKRFGTGVCKFSRN